MNCGNNYEIKKNLKKCLIQLDFLFQWLAAVENKPIEKDGARMGSNFAKYKIYPEYSDFIDYACQAEEHFSTRNYNSCGNSCRFSLEAFTDYIYKEKNLTIDSTFFALDKKGSRKLDKNKPTGYELTTGWLNAKISSSSFQNYFKEKNAFPTRREKELAAKFSHYDENTKYTAEGALSILSMIYNLYAHCVDVNYFAGSPRFDVSLLENSPVELIQPLLSIEINGIKKTISPNALMGAVQSKKASQTIIKENRSLINKTDVLGNTPLSLAVYNDDFDTVQMLLKNGADPNLYFSKDFFESVKTEISKNEEKYKGVWSEYIEAHRCIPLIVAIKKDNVDIVKLLLDAKAKTWDSCIDDYYSIARIPPECSTILGCAIFYNAKKCIRFLLKNDICNVNEEMRSGVTPLLLAAEKNIYVEKLLEKGAKIDCLDKFRNSVFLHAVQTMRHDYQFLEKLLENAQSVLSKDDFNKLINHSGLAGCPISYMDKDEVELFLEYGADINAKNQLGIPCLVDVAILNPELLPWYKAKGAQFDFKAFFYRSSYLQIKDSFRIQEYQRRFFIEVLRKLTDFISSEDLNFTVPIDNVPYISPLFNAILFTNAKSIQMRVEDGEEKSKDKFVSDSQKGEVKISPLDDALIAKTFEAAAIYLTKGIPVSELTKILLLSVHDVSDEFTSALKNRKDIDFSDVLLTLCKNHPKDDFDIAEEFINKGYNFYRFANYNLLPGFTAFFETGSLILDYDKNNLSIENEDGSINTSPSIEDVRERNNSSFLKSFGEKSFQDVNLRLIKNAISFGANSRIKDEMNKSAMDYAKENGIDETIFIVSNTNHDTYEFTVDMKPSKKGSILGHIEKNGKKIKGSISKDLIPEGKTAFDFSNQIIQVILKSELQTKQAGEPYYKLDFAP